MAALLIRPFQKFWSFCKALTTCRKLFNFAITNPFKNNYNTLPNSDSSPISQISFPQPLICLENSHNDRLLQFDLLNLRHIVLKKCWDSMFLAVHSAFKVRAGCDGERQKKKGLHWMVAGFKLFRWPQLAAARAIRSSRALSWSLLWTSSTSLIASRSNPISPNLDMSSRNCRAWWGQSMRYSMLKRIVY